MSNWKGIVGRGFTPPEFEKYVATLSFTDWRPQFAVVHNTSAPRLSQWHSHPGEERMRNLESYYRDEQKWAAGPHLFIADDLIWAFTPLTTSGVHSPSWNGVSWGIEMVGEYDEEPFHPGVRDNVVGALAVLHRWRGIDPETLHFHKEDPKTTHKRCPGSNVDKADLIARVRALMSGTASGEHQPQDDYLKIGARLAGVTPKPAATEIRRAVAVSGSVGKYALRNSLLMADPALQAVAASDLVLVRPTSSQRIDGIATVQKALNLLAAVNPNLTAVNLGRDDRYLGFFGEQTERALRVFQRSAGIGVDGKVGDDTLCALDNALEALGAQPAPKKPRGRKGKGAKRTRAAKPRKTAKLAPSTAPDGYSFPAEDRALLSNVSLGKAQPVGANYREKFDAADRGEAQDDQSRCKTLLRFEDGTIFFDAKMAICTDGSPRGDKIDPTGQTETAHSLADGQPFDAEKIPYVVLPMPDQKTGESFLSDMGLKKGDLAMVVYDGQRCGAILAELGPVNKIGETSVRTHELLPVPSPWKNAQKTRITNISVPESVLYFIFPNTAARTKKLTSATAPAEVAKLAEEAFRSFAGLA